MCMYILIYNLLGVSINSRYFAIDGTSNWWLKISDVNRRMVSLGICQ